MTEAFKQGFTDMLQKIAAATAYEAPKEYRPAQLGLQPDDYIPGRGPASPRLPSYPSYESYLINKGNISDLTKSRINSGIAQPVPAVKPRATPHERRMAPGVASRSAG